MRTIRIVNNICAFETVSSVAAGSKFPRLSFTRPSLAMVFAVALLRRCAVVARPHDGSDGSDAKG